MVLSESLRKAKSRKNDEFYTQRSDIENELRHYTEHFRNKVVYCNCDDPRISSFFHYFSYNFKRLGLRKLIASCYRNHSPDLFSRHDSERAIWLEYEGSGDSRTPRVEDIGVREFQGDGDFRSAESIELLKQADIVVTNPPFSLFREYVAHLMEHDRKFIIIGPWNAVTYKDIFHFIKTDRFWLGYGFESGNAYFAVPSEHREYVAGVYDEKSGLVKFRNVTWFTNLNHKKRHKDLILTANYSPGKYPAYDNYDAINVNKILDIPKNWGGHGGSHHLP